MAGKIYWFDNPRDVEELQRMLVESDDENDSQMYKWKWFRRWRLRGVHSEYLDTKQDISSEENEDELDMKLLGKDKESKGGKIQKEGKLENSCRAFCVNFC